MRQFDEYLRCTVDRDIIPGAVFAMGDADHVLFSAAYGVRRQLPSKEEMTVETLFDLASLTKVTAVWPAVLKLLECGMWRLDTMVGEIDPDVRDTPVGQVSICQLLTHSACLPERTWIVQYGRKREQIYRGICECGLDSEPGTRVAYSNRGFILLGCLIEKAVGMSIDEFVGRNVWSPSGMYRTRYNPEDTENAAPTEFDASQGKFICGSVHDENARVLKGVSGHAGVFSDVHDLSTFCRMIVRGGEIDGKQVLSQEWIAKSFYNYTSDLNEGRGLAWQKRPGENGMYRHFGFTGTAIWIDPQKSRWAVLLTNRVHPDREKYASGIQEVRAAVQNYLDEWR